MYSTHSDAALPAPGFPIRKSAGQRLFSASPRLIAAIHVLPRLLVPRHSPCALSILTVSTRTPKRTGVFLYPFCLYVQFSSSAEAAGGGLPPSGLWKLSSARAPARPHEAESAGQVKSGRHSGVVPATSQRGGRTPICLPRKEVIQPQLPLRLPCYDFTPITGPTFDGSLP